MSAPQSLHAFGQSLWIDNITREMLNSGTVQRYIDEFSVTGLTSNPTIFDQALLHSTAYDSAIREKAEQGRANEALFFDLAIEDIVRAADLFRPIFNRTCGVDGWVSLEVSPLLVRDTEKTLRLAKDLLAQAARPNVFIKIPGTPEGLAAIEEAVFAGVPINVTLLFSRDHYLATAEAYLRAIERRVAAGLSPDIASVASIFISRWDVAVADKVPAQLNNRLGLAIARQVYRAYTEYLASPRLHRIMNEGGRPQRLLWASTGTKDPNIPADFYIKALATPLTVNTMPEKALKSWAEKGELGAGLPADGGDSDAELAEFARAGCDIQSIATRLQQEGADSFSKSWNHLLAGIETKREAIAQLR